MKKKLVVLTIVGLLLTNCATVFEGTTRTINLQPSNLDYNAPINVQVRTKNSIQEVEIPSAVSLKAVSGNATVTVKDKCFRQTTTIIKSELDYFALGNIFFSLLGLTGTTTDILTGAMWTFDDTVINVQENGVCKATDK